jgi:hypothetical protein
MTERWQPELNLEFQKKSLPMVINHFGSLWRLKFNWRAIRRIIILLLRQMESIFGMDFRAFNWALSRRSVNTIINAIKNGIDEMISGF